MSYTNSQMYKQLFTKFQPYFTIHLVIIIRILYQNHCVDRYIIRIRCYQLSFLILYFLYFYFAFHDVCHNSIGLYFFHIHIDMVCDIVMIYTFYFLKNIELLWNHQYKNKSSRKIHQSFGFLQSVLEYAHLCKSLCKSVFLKEI